MWEELSNTISSLWSNVLSRVDSWWGLFLVLIVLIIIITIVTKYIRGEKNVFPRMIKILFRSLWDKTLTVTGAKPVVDSLVNRYDETNRPKAVHKLVEESIEVLARECRREAVREGISMRKLIDKAFNKVLEYQLPIETIAKHFNAVDGLSELYLKATKEIISDEVLFNRIEPTLKQVYPYLFEKPGFYELIQPDIERLKMTNSQENKLGVQIDQKYYKEPIQSDLSVIAELYFSNRNDYYIGRDKLLKQMVEGFVDVYSNKSEIELFRWALIYGSAGSGKSRFALEMLINSKVRLASIGCNIDFKYFGFVKRDQSDVSNSLSIEKVNEWSLDEPAFIVLDYAGVTRGLRGVIYALEERAKCLKQPIRLLLLERKIEATEINDLRPMGDGDRFDETRFDVAWNKGPGEFGIFLDSLDDPFVLKIIRDRIQRNRVLHPIEEDDDYLLRQVDLFGKGKRHPLYAAMIGAALGDREPPKSGGDINQMNRLLERDKLLKYLIDRERDRYWNVGKSYDTRSLDLHENLLTLSTFCRGLPDHILDIAEDTASLVLPTRATFDHKLYSIMTANLKELEYLSEVHLGWLEPDFIGEWFVLQRLDRSKFPQGSNVDAFLQVAWKLRVATVEQFILQCHQNHPDEVARHNYFLPEYGKYTDRVVRLLKSILTEWRMSLVLEYDEKSNSITQLQFGIGKIVEHLFKLLQNHVEAAAELTDEIKVNLASATQIYINIQAWMLSKSVREDITRNLYFVHDTGEHPEESLLSKVSYMLMSLNEQARSAGLTTHEREVQQGDVNIGGNTHAMLAAKLLDDAAAFFRTLAEQNETIREQMFENATVFNQMSSLISSDPEGDLEGTTHSELTARLLNDSAGFFDTLADQNPVIEEQMRENVNVYRQVAELVRNAPLAILN